jgi:hypothetical protein
MQPMQRMGGMMMMPGQGAGMGRMGAGMGRMGMGAMAGPPTQRDQTTDLRLKEVERKLDRLKEVEQKLDRVLRALEGAKTSQPEAAPASAPVPSATPAPSPAKDDRE